MNYKDLLLKYSHRLYRQDPFINDLYTVIGAEFDLLQYAIKTVIDNSLIDTADLATVEMYEQQMNIKPLPSQTLDERRAMIKAKWRSDGTITLEMLQNVCNAWRNGEVNAAFENGKIKLSFTGEYGIPSDLDALYAALDEVKPAHLAIEYNFKYLLIKDIHNVMTINEMETQKLRNFAGGSL